jgi:hypothetical protein
LFDVVADPEESTNLVGDPENQLMVERMRRLTDPRLAISTDPAWGGEDLP